MEHVAELPPNSTPTLRELLERLPEIVNNHASSRPTALQLEECGSADAAAELKKAQERFLKSARSFFRPCFLEAVLENLTRDDPFAQPNFDNDLPDQAVEQALQRRRMDEITKIVGAGHRENLVSTKRVDQHLTLLREQLGELDREAKAANEKGVPILNKTISDSIQDGSSESEREYEEALRDQKEAISAADARRAALAAKVAAVRDSLVLEQDEVSTLEHEQAAALAAATSEDVISKADTSRNLENMVGVADMTDAQVDAAVHEESTLVRKNGDICKWYKATVSNLQLITGVHISHRLLFENTNEEFGGRVQGLELMIDLGSGQILQVAVSAADGTIRSAEFCPSIADGKTEERMTASELAELKIAADALPSPGNLRMLVREVLGRAKCAATRSEHVRIMRRRYLVGYREATREVTITMPVGIVASLRLHPDYPKVAGGVEVMAIAGVGGWSASETKQLCREVNSLALPTLMKTMDGLEKAVAALDGQEA